jgi:hypothetical protein
MTCSEYLDAMVAANWGAIPVHLIIASIFATITWLAFTFRRRMLDDPPVPADDGRVWLALTLRRRVLDDPPVPADDGRVVAYSVGAVFGALMVVLFVGLALARAHGAIFPQDHPEAKFYCSSSPPTVIQHKLE